jgi:hypothetical protein
LALLCVCAGVGSGCTIVKPLTGAFVGPAVILGDTTCGFACDGRGFAAVLLVGSAIGAACGVVTGIVSDVQALSGAAEDPCRNWWNPLATNISEVPDEN